LSKGGVKHGFIACDQDKVSHFTRVELFDNRFLAYFTANFLKNRRCLANTLAVVFNK
jgi:hypothetical protein